MIALALVGVEGMLLLAFIAGFIGADNHDERFAMLAGGAISMHCWNLAALPISFVGIGLGIAGVVSRRDQNHLFSSIGLAGNGIIIACVILVFLVGALLGRRQARQNQFGMAAALRVVDHQEEGVEPPG